MKNLSRLAGVLACSAALATAGAVIAAPAHMQAARVSPASMFSQPVSLGRHYMPTREYAAAHRHVGPDLGQLTYRNGPVLTNPHQYVILWGFKAAGDPQKVGKLYKSYVKNFGGSALANVLTQYYDIVAGQTTYITNPTKNGKVYKDDTNPVPAHATDSQVQAEAWAMVNKYGYDAQGAYIVVSPYGHDPSGFLTQGWCSYHGASSSAGKTISYTNMPYMSDGGSSCGANIITPPSDESGANEGQTIVNGHEYAESVTDPQPSSGWYNNSYGEIGDECAWTNVQNDPFGGKSYTMQPEYSNASASCVHSY